MVNSNASASAEGEQQGGGLSASAMSSDELRDLFTLRTLTLSDTYDSMCADNNSDVDVDGVEGGPAPKEAICREQACSAASCMLLLLARNVNSGGECEAPGLDACQFSAAAG